MRLKFPALICLLACAAPLTAWGKPQQEAAKDQITRIKSAINDLIYEVDRLQEIIVEELKEPKEKQLYYQADKVMGTLIPIARKLDSQTSRELRYALFDKIDGLTQQLTKKALDAKPPAVNRAARRVNDSLLELHYTLTVGDSSPKVRLEVLKRQVRAFAAAAEKLEKTATFAFTSPAMKSSIARLAAEAQELEKAAPLARTPDDFHKGFLAVNRAWEKVVAAAKLLPPGKNVYVLRNAARLDAIHNRLFDLLKIEGKRSAFTFRI